MASINISTMKSYLSKSISSLNANKVNGMLAEIDLRNHLANLGFGDRISQGGWIVRNQSSSNFGEFTSVLFPQTIRPGANYNSHRKFENPNNALHTICSTMHQIGLHSFYCVPSIDVSNDTDSINWHLMQLGIPITKPFMPLDRTINSFLPRAKKHGFLRYKTKANQIPAVSIPEEFTKEHLRISFHNRYMAEISDIDGILWGEQHTYPIEIKEKTVANLKGFGDYFGIDVGPFVKLAFYAAKKGNLHSLFFVREINNVVERKLVNWWFITFDTLAQYASWVTIGGGKNMNGGASTVVKIPKYKFTELNAESLAQL